MARAAVLVLVGPDDVEVARAEDLFASLRGCEPAVACALVVDDSPVERGLAERLWLRAPADVMLLSRPCTGAGTERRGALTGLTLAALSQLWRRSGADLIVKLDTDALIIGPFVEALAAFFARRPEVGVAGALGDSSNPAHRIAEKSASVPLLVRALAAAEGLRDGSGESAGRAEPAGEGEAALRPIPIAGFGLVSAEQASAFAAIEPHVRAAVARGYARLEYCQGGAYAISGELLARMAAAGYFDAVDAWNQLPVGEDVAIGMYARAVGLELADYCGEQEPFGVQWQGLPYALETLVSRGHGIVHSVKNDPRYAEAAVRAFFRERRPRAGA